MKPIQVYLNIEVIRKKRNRELVSFNHTLIFEDGSKIETENTQKWQQIGLQKESEIGTILLDDNCRLYHIEY